MFCFYDKMNKVGYYPIHKNGSTTFITVARQLGWETTEDMELLPSEYKIFAHIRDPIERHFTATADYILTQKLDYTLNDKNLQKLWTSSLMDIHSYPITWVLGDIAKRIHWIPFAQGFDSTQATLDFLHKHSVVVSEIQTLNESTSLKKNVILKLMSLHADNDKYSSLTYFYEHDFKLYYKALDEYLYKKSKWTDQKK